MDNVLDAKRARAAADAALAAAQQDGKQISVIVVDHCGRDLLVVRDDGAIWFTVGVARGKAATAALMGAPSGELAGMKAEYPELFDLVGVQTTAPITTLPGGVPVRLGGTVVGAIGVSGGTPDEDVAYARAAVAALKAVSETGA